MTNLGRVLELDTSRIPPRRVHHDDEVAPENGATTPRHTLGGGGDGPRHARSRKRLRPVLRELLRSPAFARADRVIVDRGRGIPARDFFIELGSLTNKSPVGRRGGYWGTVIRVGKPENGNRWLNFSYHRGPGVLVPARRVQELLDWAGADDVDDLIGGALLILEQTKRAQSGDVYLSLPELGRCAWLPYTRVPTRHAS